MSSGGLFGWLREAPADARLALLAASLGWALDAFDTLLFVLTLPAVMVSLHLTKSSAGLLTSLTLIAAAAGGILLGLDMGSEWARQLRWLPKPGPAHVVIKR